MIVETDIGHDPDDFFTLCYLISAGVNIEAIVITPGDLDQIAICKLLCDEIGLKIPIGASKQSEKLSSGSIHHALLKKYQRSFTAQSDAPGHEILKSLVKPESEIFIIGPPSNTGKFLRENPNVYLNKATMQGGFLGYDLHPHATVRLPQFEGKTWVPTFNMNGDRKGTVALTEANINERRFCGKNVCHTVLMNQTVFSGMSKPKDRASELFMEGMEILLDRKEEKKFHDPVAAVCHLHPEIGKWVKGKVRKIEAGWGTVLDENGDYILAGLDYNKFWEHIQNWN
jgi:inosine-uridine nucleoside N-ribohydrolase